jgi:hypothetical protein
MLKIALENLWLVLVFVSTNLKQVERKPLSNDKKI